MGIMIVIDTCRSMRPAVDTCSRSNIDAAGSVEEVQRIVSQIRARWRKVRILLRADSGFARDNLMVWCEENRVDYLFGLAKNERLIAKIKPEPSGRPRRAAVWAVMLTTSRTSCGRHSTAAVAGSSTPGTSSGTRRRFRGRTAPNNQTKHPKASHPATYFHRALLYFRGTARLRRSSAKISLRKSPSSMTAAASGTGSHRTFRCPDSGHFFSVVFTNNAKT